MCAKHKKYFSERLTSWRKEIVKSNNDNVVLNNLDDNVSSADIVDQASSQTEKTVELRASNRRRKLVNKIDHALKNLKTEHMDIAKKLENLSVYKGLSQDQLQHCVLRRKKDMKKRKKYL